MACQRAAALLHMGWYAGWQPTTVIYRQADLQLSVRELDCNAGRLGPIKRRMLACACQLMLLRIVCRVNSFSCCHAAGSSPCRVQEVAVAGRERGPSHAKFC